MISVTCPSCKMVHKADESLLGRRVKCKDCGAMFDVRADHSQPTQQPNYGEVAQMAAVASAAVGKASQLAGHIRGSYGFLGRTLMFGALLMMASFFVPWWHITI